MKFALIAALMGATLVEAYETEESTLVQRDARALAQQESDDESSEEEASRFTAKEQGRAKSHVADPNVKARFEYARDKCKNVPEKKKKACFNRNWRLYKPQHKNTIFDFRARTHRKCWQYKNKIVKFHDCLDKYIKSYEDHVHQLLLSEAQNEEQQVMAQQDDMEM